MQNLISPGLKTAKSANLSKAYLQDPIHEGKYSFINDSENETSLNESAFDNFMEGIV